MDLNVPILPFPPCIVSLPRALAYVLLSATPFTATNYIPGERYTSGVRSEESHRLQIVTSIYDLCTAIKFFNETIKSSGQ
jgi:hypothetical protein